MDIARRLALACAVVVVFVTGLEAQEFLLDGTLTQQANTPGSFTGRTIALDGDTLVVGSSTDTEVFVRSGTTWVLQETLFPSGRVSLSGNTLVVGSRVFVRSGTSWTIQQVLGGCDRVSLDGDRLVYGCPTLNLAFVFERVGTTWTQSAALDPPPGMFNGFGAAVDIDGDRIIVSATNTEVFPLAYTQIIPIPGYAVIFELVGSTWDPVQVLPNPGPGTLSHFGTFVQIDGDRAVVGAPSGCFNPAIGHGPGCENPGSAHVFRRNDLDGSWSLEAKLLPSDGQGNDRFGLTGHLSGDMLIVGSPYDRGSPGGMTGFAQGRRAGGAYVFRHAGTGWTQHAKLWAPDGVFEDFFSAGLAIDSNTAVVGAPHNDAFYSFELAPSEFESFCFGNGGDGLGCTPCPCGNQARRYQRGGCLNRQDRSAVLIARGSPSVTNDTLVFNCYGGLEGTPHLLTSGDNQLPNLGPCPPGTGNVTPFLDGLRCVGGTLVRHGFRSTVIAADVVSPTNGWGGSHPPTQGILAQGGFNAGQTRHFQVFYRELPDEVCGKEQNTSNAISVTVQP